MDRMELLATFTYLRQVSDSMDMIERCKRRIRECELLIEKSKPLAIEYAAKLGLDELSPDVVQCAMEQSESCEALAHKLNVLYNQTEIKKNYGPY